jgi:hypothetical protein
MGSHFVFVNGLCASRGMGRDRAMTAARDAVAVRPDAQVSVQRIARDASPASTGETVAVLASGTRRYAATSEPVAAVAVLAGLRADAAAGRPVSLSALARAVSA